MQFRTPVLREKITYEEGYVEKALDKTLRKYGNKLAGMDWINLLHPRIEGIGLMPCEILVDRPVISADKPMTYINIDSTGWKEELITASPITYYKTIEYKESLKDRKKCYSPYLEDNLLRTFTQEHIGIKHPESNLEMVVSFKNQFDEYMDCFSLISERSPPYKPKRKLKKKGYYNISTKTRDFFVDAFNSYFHTEYNHRKFSRKIVDIHYCPPAIKQSVLLRSLPDSKPLLSSELIEGFKEIKFKLPPKGLRTKEFIEMIVDYVENRFVGL